MAVSGLSGISIVGPHHNQRDFDDMGARIFLSYGHRDAGDLAVKLRTDLDQRGGHKVWQDIDGIRFARGWSSEIADALRDSDVVIALLSPHSVRRAIDPDNPDGKDSVCIDEIEYAVDGVRIPVVPIMVRTCEAPFRIFRLQYLDFRRWQESDALYNELVGRLLVYWTPRYRRVKARHGRGGFFLNRGISRPSSRTEERGSPVATGFSKR